MGKGWPLVVVELIEVGYFIVTKDLKAAGLRLSRALCFSISSTVEKPSGLLMRY